MVSVESEIPSGYSVYLHANQLLQTEGGQAITLVSDGVVDGSSEEYGANVTGTRAYLADIDLPVTTTQRVIQTHSGLSVSPADRSAMSFKLTVTPTTLAGAYSQNVYYTLTANY
jgi:hypothetical protein